MGFLGTEVSRNTYINIMAQYHPCHKAFQVPSLARPTSSTEFHEAISLAREAGLNRLDKASRPGMLHPNEILVRNDEG
jgi:putative pyruvate formate lyase activating enzyme